MAIYSGTAAVRNIQIEQHIYQFSLTIAFYTGNPQNLTFAYVKGKFVKHFLIPFIGIFQITYTQYHICGLCLIFFYCQNNITTNHQTGDFFFGNIRCLVYTHGFPTAHDSQAVCDLLDFMQFMRNKDHGVALFF